jgi:hypothetical protein
MNRAPFAEKRMELRNLAGDGGNLSERVSEKEIGFRQMESSRPKYVMTQ